MAQVSFDSIADSINSSREGGAGAVSFFTCKENEDVVVRFLHDSTQSFDIHTVHEVSVNNRPRDYECTRDPHDPVEACPLCAAASGKLKQKIYVHLIKYTRNEQGAIIATPCCWVRPIGFALQLKEFIENYGPLSEVLFKVKRTGQSLDTRYNVMYAPPTVCPPANFSMEAASVFAGWSPVGSQIRKQSSENRASTAPAAPQVAPYFEAPSTPAMPNTFAVPAAPQVAPQAAPQAASRPAPSAAERFPAASPWDRVQGSGNFAGVPGRPDRY